MNDILKQEWGFTGFITSDFHAVHSSAQTALAGLDLEMPTGDYFSNRLKKDIESDKVPMAVVDDKLVRRFRAMMEIGVWDHLPMPHPLPEKENGAIARQLAEEGMVLLKNNGLLPLKAEELKLVALIGPYAQRASTGAAAARTCNRCTRSIRWMGSGTSCARRRRWLFSTAPILLPRQQRRRWPTSPLS